MTNNYNEFERNIEKYTGRMSFPASIKTRRKGWGKLRDWFINIERFYSEGNSYLALVVSLFSLLIVVSALGGEAIRNFNVWYALLGISIVVGTVSLGYLSYTKLGLVGRVNELDGKSDGGRFQIWGELQDVKAQNIAMLRQMDVLLQYHKGMKRWHKK